MPSKSGVIGLLCAALGRSREQSVDDLAALRFGVAIERRGSVLRDFHTVGAGTDPVAVASGARGRGVVTERYYLEDASFVAGLESPDEALTRELLYAVRRPRWPLSLGRRSCPPAGPVVDDNALFAGSLEDALAERWRPQGVESRLAGRGTSVEAVVEDPAGPQRVFDQPTGSAYSDRTFSLRGSRHVTLSPPADR